MREILLGALVLALVIGALPQPASAAPLAAVPATVRVNIAGLGTISAAISPLGGDVMTVRQSDGTVVYEGGARAVARKDVYRLAEGVSISPRGVPSDPRMRFSRAALLRDVRLAEHELGPNAILVVPFELAVVTKLENPVGDPVLRAAAVVGLHFAADDGLLTFNGKIFRGTLELTLDDAGDMIVVNEVDTAAYLASVVGTEIPANWAPQALEAQAIAARTYLLTHLRRHRAYDLEGDVRDQAYSGLAGEREETVAAVRKTSGIIATYRGAAIEALYSANAGGATENSENVYRNALPYLRSVESPWDVEAEVSGWGGTSWEWTKEVTAPQLAQYLRVRGIDVGEPLRVELVNVSPTGRVLQARVVGTERSQLIGKDASRYYFGLRSTMFTVNVRDGGEEEAIASTDVDRIKELVRLGAKPTRARYRVIRDEEKVVSFVRIGSMYELPSRFVFAGRGFGHGVGMSQWGMQGMALQGYTAEEILKHYYQGIELTNVGGA